MLSENLVTSNQIWSHSKGRETGTQGGAASADSAVSRHGHIIMKQIFVHNHLSMLRLGLVKEDDSAKKMINALIHHKNYDR